MHLRQSEISNLKFLFVLFVSFVVPSAFADEGWSLTTADFKRQNVNLRAFDEAGAKVVPYGQKDEITIPLDKLLQLDRGGAAVQQVRGTFTLYLTSGDRVGGEPIAIANDQVTCRSPAAVDLTIPLKDLRAIQRGGLD